MKSWNPHIAAAALAAIAVPAFAATAAAESFVVGVENIDYRPHYGMENGEYTGFGRAVLDAFAADTGHELEYRALPIKRLFQALVDGEIDAKYPDNAYWSAGLKEGADVVYSDPVVSYIDGVLVPKDAVGEGPGRIETLGTVTGFTPWAWTDRIESGAVSVSENPRFSSLVKQAIGGRIDGLYSNVSVAAFRLEEIGQADALVFDPDLPHTASDYHLSTTTEPGLVEAFDAWMAENADKVAALKAEYDVGATEE